MHHYQVDTSQSVRLTPFLLLLSKGREKEIEEKQSWRCTLVGERGEVSTGKKERWMCLELANPIPPCADTGVPPSHMPMLLTHGPLVSILGTFNHSSSFCHKGFFSIVRFTPQMAASPDYRRRRPRRSFIPKTTRSPPKGFSPRPPVSGTRIRKKDKVHPEEKGEQETLKYGEPIVPDPPVQRSDVISTRRMKKSTHIAEEVEREIFAGDRSAMVFFEKVEEESDVDLPCKLSSTIAGVSTIDDDRVDEKEITLMSTDEGASTPIISIEHITGVGFTHGVITEEEQSIGDGIIAEPTSIDGDHVDEKETNGIAIIPVISIEHRIGVEEVEDSAHDIISDEEQIIEDDDGKQVDGKETNGSASTPVISIEEHITGAEDVKDSTQGVMIEEENDTENIPCELTPTDEKEIMAISTNSVAGTLVNNIKHVVTVEAEDLSQGVIYDEQAIEDDEGMVQEKIEFDAEAHREMIEKLTKEKLSNGIKLFVYPEVVRPNQVIEVFFNRQASDLRNEPDVLIKGAFNDWKWKPFTERLQKSNLKGDWWTCKVQILNEAYKMDFVFFNGRNIYDNNDSKDYFLTVEGGIGVLEFEDFLVEEKKRKLEKFSLERAERERKAEELHKEEEENVGMRADREMAKLEVAKKWEDLSHLTKVMEHAQISADNLWHIEHITSVKSEDRIRLFYNRASRPLSHSEALWLHGGHSNWTDGLSIVVRLFPLERTDGDWWYADVILPDRTLVLDWVFADGPPGSAKVYDNNNGHDFHSIIQNSISKEQYCIKEEEQIYKRLQEERKLKEADIRIKTARSAQMKVEMKEKTMKTFLLSQRHILYTEPLDVQAGNIVTVFYNSSATVLSGKPNVWFRCSFNRWTHQNGSLPPQKMVPTGDGSLVKASVEVPLDAYMMDFVFSEREDGGIYDNRNEMDYHIPVSGGTSKEPPMNIVHVAVEMAPIAKVGGLGDVVTSHSRAVQELGHNVEIILPKYDCMIISNVRDLVFHQSFGWGGTDIKVWLGKVEGLSVYFLEPQNGMFSAGCIYGCGNDGQRFSFFCRAALEFLHQKGAQPDILHCHDWSSAPVAWLFKEHYRHQGLSNARVIFTIHNLEFGAGSIGKAMLHADKATTVSQKYSKEVSGNPVIAPHLQKFHGIVNGIDPDIWDPYTDTFIPMSYTSNSVVEGKQVAKESLQRKLGLKVSSDYPIVGIITRLTYQKGIHLIMHAIRKTLDGNGQVVLLGSAPDHRIQNDFSNLANQLHSSHAGQVRLCLTYDEPLSHLIYAGSDFIIVPSIFEPCGLTQLIAMRYGSIPIVHKTGGLHDTVFDVDNDKGRAEKQGLEPNGFSFDGADANGVDYALNRAFSAWFNDRSWLNSLSKRVMEQDWSWNRPALDYMELYHSARKL